MFYCMFYFTCDRSLIDEGEAASQSYAIAFCHSVNSAIALLTSVRLIASSALQSQ